MILIVKDMIVKDFLGDDYTFIVELKDRSHFTKSVQFFLFLKK